MRPTSPTSLALGLTVLLAVLPPAHAEVDFAREVLPILSDKCFLCHGPDTKKETELRLDSYEGAIEERDGIRAINPAHLDRSELVARIFDHGDPMPPEDAEKQLTDAERDTLKRWVEEGGQYAQHWSFVPPVKPEAESTIDGFIEAQLKEQGLDFAPAADRATLARRAALILTGLPPEPAQLAAFLANPDPEKAYAELVDQLLASPHYGEHQARYWLDAIRYGDTHGLHLDNRRGIFPFRDWVILALNDNLPLDQFITWQLAGDLLPEPDLEQLVATGFVRMNPSTAEGGAIPAEFQAKNNFDRVENFGTVFLGLSLNCVRCHTHKYDPIPHREYYELMAFFNSTAEGPMDGNKYEYAPTLRAPADLDGWERWRELTAQRDALAADHPDRAKLDAEFGELEKTFTTTLVAKELDKPRPTHILERGEYDIPIGDPVAPSTIRVAGPLPADAPANRLGLAAWLTSPDNPLTARVLINRVWQSAFGFGLVRTPEDFGLQGEQPTHPELLDWLSVELQESGWDLQHMLRLMVMSEAFRQDSRWRDDLDDPENRLLARGPGFRLDAEVLRDIGLWSSGLLDLTMGGEGIKPYQPAGMWSALMHPGSDTKNYVPDTGARAYRRSLYVYWKRTSPHPMMTLFDAPSRETACVRRSRSNTPLQSLGLLNEDQRTEMARALADRLLREAPDDPARLDLLFTLLASRPPVEAERAACNALLEDMTAHFAADQEAAGLLVNDPQHASADLAHRAAWIQVASTVLASDLAILLY